MKHLKKYDQFINEKYLDTRYSAGLAIVFDGKILLGQSRGRKEGTGYGISKGGIEEGESHLDAAIRETYEEFGIKVPKSLISKIEHTFVNEISRLDAKIDLVVPKGQLQREEIDNAKFMDKIEASQVVMLSQQVVLQNLSAMGLI